MPSPKKVAWSQLRVGIMAVIALVVVVVLLFLMTGNQNPFSRKVVVYTFLGDSAAMTEGSAVRLNGILVGKVSRIGLSGEDDNRRAIRMELELDEEFLARIPIDSMIGFSAENVLGSKFLNIKRGEADETLKAGGVLRAKDDKDFLEVVQSAQPLLESLLSILRRVDALVGVIEQGKGSIGKLLVDEELYRNLNRAASDVTKITDAAATGKGTFGKLLHDPALYDDLRATISKVDILVADLNAGKGTAGKLLKDPALYDELRKTNAEIRTLIADLNAGKGTAGKFLKDEALHNRILATVDKLNGTIDRMNAGQGTLGQLLVNPSLYESLTGTSQEVQSLMKDFRANPKKFLTIQLKLF